jgi:hypothetical protein
MSGWVPPPLTTIIQPLAQMAAMATRTILAARRPHGHLEQPGRADHVAGRPGQHGSAAEKGGRPRGREGRAGRHQIQPPRPRGPVQLTGAGSVSSHLHVASACFCTRGAGTDRRIPGMFRRRRWRRIMLRMRFSRRDSRLLEY